MRNLNIKRRFASGVIKDFLADNWLLLCTILGVVIGIAVGFLNYYLWIEKNPQSAAKIIYYWGFLGEVVLMNSLKCITIPVIVFSIVTGTARMTANAGKLASYAMGYFLATTLLAIINGSLVALAMRPGKYSNQTDVKTNKFTNTTLNIQDGLLDIIRNCFPRNIFEATIIRAESKTSTDFKTVSVSYPTGTNTLGLIVFSAVFGYYLGKLVKRGNEEATLVLKIFSGMNSAVMYMFDLIMLYYPIGLCFLLSKSIMGMGKDRPMADTWAQLGLFIAACVVSLFIHSFIIIPLVYYAVIRKNPFKYMKGVSQALLTAFASASSAATMPITLRCCETKNSIDPDVSRFIIPLGATVNMDGTAAFLTISAQFIAYLNNSSLDASKIFIIAGTSFASSIGAPAIPSSSLVLLVMVLEAADLGAYTTTIGLIYSVDWFVDRLRTATNVWGDTVGCACVQHWAGDSLYQDSDGTEINEMHDNQAFSNA